MSELTYSGDGGGGRGMELRCSECGDGGDGFCKGEYFFFLSFIVKFMLFHDCSGIGGVVVVVGMMVWY